VSLSLAEARTEARDMLQKADAILTKYDDGVIDNNEDRAEWDRLMGEVGTIEAKIGSLEEGENRKASLARQMTRYTVPAEPMRHASGSLDLGDDAKSIGQIFIENRQYQQALADRLFAMPGNVVTFTVPLSGSKARLLDEAKMQRKALVYSGSGVAGPLIVEDRRPGIIPIDVRERTLLDVVTQLDTNSDSIEYVRMNTFTNNAATVAEATVTTGTTGLKPESAMALQKVTVPVEIVAHWMPVTNKMLADAPAIRGLIDNHLLLGLELELEDQIISGNGTPPNLTGILNAGIQAYGAGSSANVADAILHGRAMVRVVGKALPNAVVMHPYDWEAVRIMRENAATGTLGGYLIGPPTVAGPMTLWGMPVIEAEGIPENTALVGDFRSGGALFMREEAQIRVGVINDQFVRNMQTILAELRAAWATFRPNCFVQVTGV
jgi:HK97 family phage major capsid protein